MFDDEKDREEKGEDLDVEPEEVEDLDAAEEDEDVKGGMMAEEKQGSITCCSGGSHCSRC